MNKFILLIFLVGQSVLGHAQEFNYKYVRVPEKFEFLKEENRYQLNELAAFLLEKHGFEKVLYKEDAPRGTAPCEILTANVENHSGLFRRRVKVTLEDCNQNIVFTSEEGVSKEKEYEKSYHEALRKAFQSVEEFLPRME